MPDLVEGQGHGLQRRQAVQGAHRDLRQRVIVQPQVTQRQQPLKAPVGHHGDEVCIQAAAWERNRVGISESPSPGVVQMEDAKAGWIDGQGDWAGL